METQKTVDVLYPAPERHAGEIDKDDYLCKFSLRHPGLFVSMVSLNYPFKETHLQRYKAILDWKGLTENLLQRPEKSERAAEALPASPEREEELILYYFRNLEEADEEIVEDIISHFPFTAENIGRFIKKMSDQDTVDIFSTLVSRTDKLQWNEEVIDRYAGFWDWGELAANENLPWTPEFIKRYADKWDWYRLSSNTALPWSEELIDRFLFRWHWTWPYWADLFDLIHGLGGLSGNNGVKLSEPIIRKYGDYWDWRALSRRCGNLADRKLFLTFLKQWDRTSISYSALPDDMGLLEEFDWFWDWSAISGNRGIHFTPELLEKYQERLNWKKLSRNRHILGSMELIEKYPDKWNWSWISHESPCCESLPFIHRNHNHIDFTSLGFNDHVRWCVELLCAYEERFDFKTLSTKYSFKKIENFLWDQVFSGWLDEKRLKSILDEIERLNLKEMPF